MRVETLRAVLAISLLACHTLSEAGAGTPVPAGGGFQGTVTQIQGNTITIRDANGFERRLRVTSTKGLQKGATAICGEDCDRTLQVGGKIVRVQGVR